MKMKSQNKWLILASILMFFLVTAYGVIGSVLKAKHVCESYKTGITLNKTVVFDDPHIVKQYGGPITLEAGTAGEIFDVIDRYTEEHNYKHIRASFPLDEGKEIDVILGYEMESGKDTDIIIDTYTVPENPFEDESETYTFEVKTPEININIINDSQRIISEFNQARVRYNQNIKQTIISGSIVAVICALAFVAVIWFVNLFVQKEQVEKVLVILTICFDVVMILVDLFMYNITLHH
jgi:hypothetical protein